MNNKLVPLPTVLLLMLTLSVVSASIQNWTFHNQVSGQLDELKRKEIERMLSTTWTHNGQPMTLTTTWKEPSLPDETFAEFLARHAAEVAEAQAAFPPDGGGTGGAPGGGPAGG